MSVRARNILTYVVMAIIVGLMGLAMWMQYGENPPLLMRRVLLPEVMSTQMRITAVVRPERGGRMDAIIAAGEAAARDVAGKMNVYDPASELSRFNASSAGELVPLSLPTLDVLTRASVIWEQTDGAFDVTIRPLIQLWQRRGEEGRLPTPEEIRRARRASRWEDIQLLDVGAIKDSHSAEVDLGGIAKGFAIDRAVEAMRDDGAVGGVVDIGGDVRCFGIKPSEDNSNPPWTVAVPDPFRPDERAVAILGVHDRAVCTSGNYRRYKIVDGKAYSHIIDPRTGRPADKYPSVTVVAPEAVVADAWATALSVLGPEGLAKLEGTNIDAMIVVGTPEERYWVATPGFDAWLLEAPTFPRREMSSAD